MTELNALTVKILTAAFNEFSLSVKAAIAADDPLGVAYLDEVFRENYCEIAESCRRFIAGLAKIHAAAMAGKDA